jgi:hypothetical protein
VVPGFQEKVQGEVQPAPSTVNDRPVGALVTTYCTANTAKLAVTLLGAFMVRFCGVVVPLRAPVKPENWKPLLAVAATETTAPLVYQLLAGLIVPPALAAVVR